MNRNHYPLILASLLGVGMMALPLNGASAAIMQPVASEAVTGHNPLLHGVDIEISWDRHRHGDRFRDRHGVYTHFHDGYYYSSPWWTETAPLVVLDDDDGGFGDDHVEWCMDRYRSYNPDNNTWVSYSGEIRECISPFDD